MRKALAIDAAALVLYAVVSLPWMTGVAVHEWLGLGVFAVLLVHVVQHAEWVSDTLRMLAGGAPPAARAGRLVLDVLIAVTLAVVVVSGVMVSGAVLPALGLFAPGYYFWDPLHAVSAKVLLALLLVHVAANAAVAVGKWRRSREEREEGK